MTTDQERQLVVTWQDPAPAAEKVTSMSGLAYLTAVMNGELPMAPIARLLGLRVAAVETGRVVIAGSPGEQHQNPIGTVHGGYLSAMLDSSMSCAVHAALEAGIGYSTVSLQVSFVRAPRAGGPELLAEGRVVHLGKRHATADGTLRDAGGTLYAHATTTCLILR
ncbi:PaaI family thioesterase [Sorangium sp. So ce291]|uniref:PaaI family thioesterase n=1 Tax=Sorangium sp. So ce291 TaxID=3133294 RepID=UPI003F62B330